MLYTVKNQLINRVKLLVVMGAFILASLPLASPMLMNNVAEPVAVEIANKPERSGSTSYKTHPDDGKTNGDVDDNFGYIWGGA